MFVSEWNVASCESRYPTLSAMKPRLGWGTHVRVEWNVASCESCYPTLSAMKPRLGWGTHVRV